LTVTEQRTTSFSNLQTQVLAEISTVLGKIDPGTYETFCATIAGARRVVCFGMGREGLAIRALCMRLAHMGFDAHVAGDVTAMPVTAGDVVLVTSGPGNLTLTHGMIDLGRRAGATVVVVTSQPDAPDPQAADLAVTIPAQTMATDIGSRSVLAMGTAFEIAMGIFFDLAVIRIQQLRGQSLEDMRKRHFNLE
jgi:6-phospho-3-hexuloisomerase